MSYISTACQYCMNVDSFKQLGTQKSMNRREKTQDTGETLNYLLSLLFSKEDFNPKAFLPLNAEISKDPTLSHPSCIIFALYNLFIREDTAQVALNCLQKVEVSHPNSTAAVCSMIIRSAFEAYNKKYKQSLDYLVAAYQIGTTSEIDRAHADFYQKVIAKIIEIHDLTTFRRQYLELIEKVLTQFKNVMPEAEFIHALQFRQSQLKEKVCLTKHKAKVETSNSTSKLSKKKTEYQSSINPYDDKKSSCSRVSSQQSLSRGGTRIPKRQFKKFQYVNPYDYTEQKNDYCAFM